MQYEALTAPLPARPPAVLPSVPRPDEGPRAVWISGASSPLCKFAHKSSTQATGTYALHDHPFYEIVYIVSGEVEFMAGTEPFRLGNHSLVAFPPGFRHGVLVDTDCPYERYTLHFDAECLTTDRRMLLQEVFPPHLSGADSGAGAACVWRGMEHSGVLRCLEALEALRLGSGETASMLLPVYVEAVLAALYAFQQAKGRPPRQDPRPSTVQQDLVLWVEQHFTEPVSLDSLAERFFLSRGYVNTLFRRVTGKSVKSYVTARRMAYVQTLLTSGLPAAQAAARAGFEDYTTFYRAYVRTYGHAPSAARQAGVRNDLLLEALAPRPGAVRFSSGGVIYPENGTDREDPSMRNTVQLSPGANPDHG